jgi:single-stranded DNA-binding protein
MSILCGFVGTLTADAINRTSAGGKNWTALNVRVGTGQATQWCSVAVFGDDAAAVASLKTGAAVYCEGRLELRRWENHGGHKMSGLSVVATFSRPIDLKAKPKREKKDEPPGSGRERAARSDSRPNGNSGSAFNDDIPFAPEVR